MKKVPKNSKSIEGPAPRKLKLPGNHPRLDGNCLPIFSQNFALYYTIFTKLTSFKKQFIFFLNFLDFFQPTTRLPAD